MLGTAGQDMGHVHPPSRWPGLLEPFVPGAARRGGLVGLQPFPPHLPMPARSRGAAGGGCGGPPRRLPAAVR